MVLERQEKLEAEHVRFQEENVRLAADYKSLHHQNIALKEKMDSLHVRMETCERDIFNLKRADHRHDEDSEQVAFSVVSHQNFGPVEVDTNIPYEIIFTNVGGGWNSTTNSFHASVSGVYMFTASMGSHSDSNDTNVICHMVHSFDGGQTRLATIEGRGEGGHSDANSAILEMEVGEVVSVQLQAGEAMVGSSPTRVRSTFSGFLLFQ